MQTGTKISALAHVTLVAWAFLGGAFRSDPLPFEVQEVSVISAEEFAALSAPREAPEIIPQPVEPEQPTAPIEQPAPVEPAPEPEPEPVRPEPQPVARPEPEPAPQPVEPTPEPQVPSEAPSLERPEPETVLLPEPPGKRPKPRPVERVAPEPVAAPPPDARPDPVETPPVSAEQGAETPQPEQPATAPEEATDRIEPEADPTTEVAPSRSPRPKTRPQQPTQTAETKPAATPEAKPAAKPEANPAPASQAAETRSAVNDALAEALAATEEPAAAPAPTGPPLTSGEKDALRVAVSQCWNVGSLSSEALRTTVVVSVRMNADGTPDTGSIRMIESSGGSSGAAKQAYEAARRAIIRCGAKGYKLPSEKYDHWRDIEMTFNPERMRIK
ncbi:energy transducer TonB [Ruegeria pomeroyi]|nr:energy transducer TonB [Ruegeria pomeroyi]